MWRTRLAKSDCASCYTLVFLQLLVMACDAVKTVFQKDLVGEASLEVSNLTDVCMCDVCSGNQVLCVVW